MLGQALVRVFRDAEVIAWDRDECDITDQSHVVQKIMEAKPHVIINTAALNAVDFAESNAWLADRVNGAAVGYLTEAAASVGATFVHYSTDYVFDGTKKDGYREDDAPNPISAYGRSKLLGEQKVITASGGTPPKAVATCYLIRTSRLFGKQGSGKQNFVDMILALAQKKDTLEIVDEELSSPTYVEDLAMRTREIIEQKKSSGIYHVTNSGAVTWYGFAQEIFATAKELGICAKVPILKPVPSNTFPRPAKRPAYSQLLNTKLSPMRSWQEALRAYLSSQ